MRCRIISFLGSLRVINQINPQYDQRWTLDSEQSPTSHSASRGCQPVGSIGASACSNPLADAKRLAAMDRSFWTLRVYFALVVAIVALHLVRQPCSADPPAADPGPLEIPLTASDRQHWAFQPIRRPAVPSVSNVDWCRTPIDRFILAQLETAGLSPLSEAERPVLLRRVTFDLTGLPPTPDELEAFLHDDSPAAYDRVVNRLLASAAYGERWAQHWLDLARFAETDGFEHDLVRPNAWRYRDWVIDALNKDVPFDEFLRLQLAGDELHPDDESAVIATGFLLCGPDMPDINLPEERRSIFLNDLTGTIGSALLGLQVGCAQCHDHKYDPLSQFDFYRLRAFFDPVEIFKDHPLPQPAPPPPSPAERELIDRLVAAEGELRALDDLLRQRLKVENPDLQPTRDDLLKALTDEEKPRHTQLSQTIATLKKSVPTREIPLGRVVRESAANVKPSRLLIRGDFRREGPEVAPAYVRVADLKTSPLAPPSEGKTTTGRRTQLADWLLDSENPLTTRVIVNRLWQHHFGRGLVETGSDFGKMGSDPTHPELLDWLATELPRQGWSLNALHRLIVTSAVYRQSSRPRLTDQSPAQTARDNWHRALQLDPDNRLLGHSPRQRLDGETIRDALLATGGRLMARRGGPGVRPPLPAELVATLLKDQWQVSPDETDHNRRSIYLFVRRNLRFPLFEAFDRPDTSASCARRNRSTIAPQALILLNSELSLASARDLAGRLLAEPGEAAKQQVRRAYRITLGRDPSAGEAEMALEFLTVQAARLRDSNRPATDLALPRPYPAGTDPYAAAALTDFCLALFNLNEFVYVD
ncbi:MAG: DUF1553 domain-containing protein [Planctomycetaceae bacterium]|nr:DUF1553 domain-containing protein [Planctomycetaceae bacterium]